MEMKTGSTVRVLVTAGSKHGSTTEIANHIAETLRHEGVETTESPPSQVDDTSPYGVVILGSAVYAGHWTDDAKALAARIGASDHRPEVWLFSSGPIGDPPRPEEDPVDVAEVMQVTGAREHRVFSGKIDKSKLSFGEKAIVVAFRAPEGDFRSWDEIADWARSIAKASYGEVMST
jgi:menaquinone-dependent protoporphyrinogen oxidase